MYKYIFLYSLYLLLILTGCKSRQVGMDDIKCLRIINTKITKELKRELEADYECLQNDIKLIMDFYVDEKGNADSIIFIRSNLKEMGINEEAIHNSLMKYRYKCIRDAYYSYGLNPSFITVVFKPDLIK